MCSIRTQRIGGTVNQSIFFVNLLIKISVLIWRPWNIVLFCIFLPTRVSISVLFISFYPFTWQSNFSICIRQCQNIDLSMLLLSFAQLQPACKITHTSVPLVHPLKTIQINVQITAVCLFCAEGCAMYLRVVQRLSVTSSQQTSTVLFSFSNLLN